MADDNAKTFSAADYVIFAGMLIISAGIGVYHALTGGRQRTTQEFLMADRKMNPIPVAFSLVASFISAITFLGTPAENYVHGCMYWMFGFAYIGVGLATAFFYLPMFYRLNLTSANEYLERRFSRAVRICGMLTFCAQTVIYMGIVIYAPALALSAVTGLNLWGSVLAIGIVCTFYTTIGGMKAVLWTDVFQVTVMMIGFLAIIIETSIRLGGMGNAWRIADEGGRIDFIDFNPDPTVRHTFWSVVIGGTFTWTAVYGVNQSQVQRYLTCGDVKVAKQAVLYATIGMVIVVCFACLSGIVMYAFYADCDPYTLGKVSQTDQLVPYLVMDIFGNRPGLPGLLVSAAFSAALSTVSSGLNSLAAVTGEDIVKSIWPNMSEAKYTKITKMFAAMYGILCIAMAFLASVMGSILQTALSIFGMIGGPLLGLFSSGMFFPWTNSIGAMSGLFTGLVFTFWVKIGSQIYPPPSDKPPLSIAGCPVDNSTMFNSTDFMETTVEAVTYSMINATAPMMEEAGRPAIAQLYALSYSWYSAAAWLVTVFVALVVSFITGPTKPADLDPRLFCSVVDTMYCCLPERVKRIFRCGVENYEDVPTEDVEKDGEEKVPQTGDNELRIEAEVPTQNGKSPSEENTKF
ncbi:sodium-coupled monocarboxylate transporter 1-like [Diadema antillarum]|uniref:sodium-coupled monocarboxylate transporter 1-like n=2 Tax=Diadema antillarum TaxID=105358 RepID=UPI003A84AD9E